MAQNYPNTNVEIWAKQDIEQAIDRGQLILNSTKSSLQACSYNLRIGTIFRDGQIINDSHPEANLQFIINPLVKLCVAVIMAFSSDSLY